MKYNLRNNKNHLSWDEYFINIAQITALRSKDPSRKVGACIVNEYNRIIGVGYNGFIELENDQNDEVFPWDKKSDDLSETKYPYIIHAEMNAILNCNAAPTHNCRMYVTTFPCSECAKLIAQVGIKKVIYIDDYDSHIESQELSKKIFDSVGIEYIKYNID